MESLPQEKTFCIGLFFFVDQRLKLVFWCLGLSVSAG